VSDTTIFLWGFGGSVAIEIVTIMQFFEQDKIVFPERYSRITFYIVRFILAAIGGGLAVAYGIDKPLLAANIGAATPLIIRTFSQVIPQKPQRPNG